MHQTPARRTSLSRRSESNRNDLPACWNIRMQGRSSRVNLRPTRRAVLSTSRKPMWRLRRTRAGSCLGGVPSRHTREVDAEICGRSHFLQRSKRRPMHQTPARRTRLSRSADRNRNDLPRLNGVRQHHVSLHVGTCRSSRVILRLTRRAVLSTSRKPMWRLRRTRACSFLGGVPSRHPKAYSGG